MSKQKKNSLLAGHSRSAHTTSAKDEIMAMKYIMDKPALPVYALDEKQPPKVYPDYAPWQEDENLKEKLKNLTFLNKGYFELPLVSNEYYSARNLIQETLFLSTQNCTTILKELSQHFTKAYKTRNEVINKISYGSNNFRVPPRVTLTAAKKEAWLKDLANQDVPLLAVSVKIPHGIRNKILVDNMCNFAVPLSRAIWFTKCSLYSELLLLRKKYQSKQSSLPQPSLVNFPPIEVFESRWLQEWTQQVADYILKFSREMPAIGSPERKGQFQTKLNYLLAYTQALYVECLIDRVYFLTAVAKFFREYLPFEASDLALLLDLSKAEEGEEIPLLTQLLKGRPINYGQILIALTLITMFWNDVLEEDFLCKYLSELLLLNYFLVEKLPVILEKTSRSPIISSSLLPKLKADLLLLLSASIKKLFKFNTNVFIVPSYWVLIGDVLYKILSQDNLDPLQNENLHKVLQLINFRNESLMLNMKYLVRDEPALSPKLGRRSSVLELENSSKSLLRVEEAEHTFINRSSDDNLKFIEQLDNLKLNNSFTELLKPKASTGYEPQTWKTKLKIVVYWCVTVYRDMGASSEKVLIICNFLKRKVLQAMTTRGSSYLKAEFENELLESIFSLSQVLHDNISMYNLYVLINELYQLKIISISSYLRKIIACGVFYKSSEENENLSQAANDPLIKFHLLILQNLPVLNNRQCDHILKKWTTEGFNFSDHFTRGTDILQHHILDKFSSNAFGTDLDLNLAQIEHLNVGVKFLLVNWLTSQIKKVISNSPKLIHISPSTIAHIYKFYSVTDNLTVFFKVFIKFVLKNENKIIIFYLDTLHFISKLILQHYQLVKYIAGNSSESVSCAYELFRLVISAYKDLLSRETDIFHFKSIWRFIENSLERTTEETSVSNYPKSYDKLLFDKETAESPLKLTSHSTRQADAYSAESFREDLFGLIATNPGGLSQSELGECFDELQNLGVGFTLDQFSPITKPEKVVDLILQEWYGRAKELSESEELIFYKLLETLRRHLKIESDILFRTYIENFVQSKIEENQEIPRLAILLAKLAIHEFLLIYDLFNIVRQLKSEQSEQLTETFTFSSENLKLGLVNYQWLLWTSIQAEYSKKHFDDVIIFSLGKLKVNGLESGVFAQNKDSVLSVVRNALILHRKWTMHFLSNEINPNDAVAICDQLLPSRYLVRTYEDMANLARALNEFSLPIIQTLLKIITSQMSEKLAIGNLTSVILDNLHFLFGPYNSYLGEMFSFVEWNVKLHIFNYLEKIFLTQVQFDQVWDLENAMVTEDVHYVSLRLNDDSTEAIPLFKDFFEKFSVASVDKLDTPPELFQDLSNFLVKLLQLLNNQAAVQLEDKSIYDTILIVLRLLIIHQLSLTSAMAREDSVNFVFLKNLVALLNSTYLSNGHEKLRILLYDLLLLMKSSLTQIFSVPNEDNLMATLPNPQLTTPEDKKEMDYAGATLANMTSILNLPEPNTEIPFEILQNEDECALVMDENELKYDGDVCFVNQSGLVLQNCRRDSLFGHLMGHNENPTLPFQVKSLKLIEDTSTALNDGCINLSLFDAYTTKENPL